MIVAILLAYLDRIGKRQHFRDVFIGVVLAVILAAGGGVAAYYFIGSYDGSNVQTIFETITFVVAAAILTYMTFWMLRNARTISADLQQRAERAMSRGERLGLGLLSFQAVGREGLETAVFTLAIVFAAQRQGARGFAASPQGELVGAALGLAAALCLAVRDVPPREAHQPRSLLHLPRGACSWPSRPGSSPTPSRTCNSSAG